MTLVVLRPPDAESRLVCQFGDVHTGLMEDSMNQAISTLSPSRAAQGTSLTRNVSAGSRMKYSRLIGALFLAGFLSYGVGFGLVTSVIGAPDFLMTISAHQTILALGAFLMLLN